MKPTIRIAIGMAIMVASCGQAVLREEPNFLPGIYVSQSENEFCRIVDTFIVRKSSLDGDGYEVTRRSSFQRIRQGAKGAEEYQSEQWSAIYDVQSKTLRATDKGKELVYTPNQNRVYNGNTGYVKVE
jgi:hypothetical protein